MALLGPNGSGKTTLLRTILSDIPPLAGRIRIGAGVHIGYFAQGHTGLDLEKEVLETVLDAGLASLKQARDLLGRYRFSGDDVFKRVGDLSGGEKARLALAVLALQGANLLLLDEPTNHLDIPSQEVLQEALASFQGTVLLVAHDRYLIRALATRVWAIANGRLHRFDGYDAYRAWVRARRTERGEKRVRRRPPRARQQAKQKASRQQAEIEEAIQRLEAQLAQLEEELSAASVAQDVDRVVELGAEHGRLQAELKAHWARWEEVV